MIGQTARFDEPDAEERRNASRSAEETRGSVSFISSLLFFSSPLRPQR